MHRSTTLVHAKGSSRLLHSAAREVVVGKRMLPVVFTSDSNTVGGQLLASLPHVDAVRTSRRGLSRYTPYDTLPLSNLDVHRRTLCHCPVIGDVAATPYRYHAHSHRRYLSESAKRREGLNQACRISERGKMTTQDASKVLTTRTTS